MFFKFLLCSYYSFPYLVYPFMSIIIILLNSSEIYPLQTLIHNFHIQSYTISLTFLIISPVMKCKRYVKEVWKWMCIKVRRLVSGSSLKSVGWNYGESIGIDVGCSLLRWKILDVKIDNWRMCVLRGLTCCKVVKENKCEY